MSRERKNLFPVTRDVTNLFLEIHEIFNVSDNILGTDSEGSVFQVLEGDVYYVICQHDSERP